MRFFTIGIGNGISPFLIQGVAKAGRGDYDFVKDDENIEQKTQYLIKSAITPLLKDFKITFSGKAYPTLPKADKLGFVKKNERFELLIFLDKAFVDGASSEEVKIEYYDSFANQKYSVNV